MTLSCPYIVHTKTVRFRVNRLTNMWTNFSALVWTFFPPSSFSDGPFFRGRFFLVDLFSVEFFSYNLLLGCSDRTSRFLERDVMYTSCAYATMSVSVCLSVTEVNWRIIANLGFKFRSKFTAHCRRGEGSSQQQHIALCYSHC